ncbi:MAG: hypothetical protein MR433_04380 [Coriobacteriaceae bacterium]|nr:hypothetical protein [Coriobacteriaceae bacterium]MDY5808163.1 hypothetical protein [Coriobacteriales bacterium]
MGMLELHVLRSGDKGSCAAVRLAGAEEFACVDCGITGTTFADACAQAGLIPFKVQAFLITHCHSNQVKGLKSTLTWLQKRGVAPQVYVEPGVLAASPVLQELQGIADVCEFHTKQPFWVGDVCVRPFRTFHNNEDKGSCYNFRFETRASGDEQTDSLVLLSDVGVLSREAQSELPHARLLAIEANYDAGLLDEAVQANSQVRFAVDVRGNFSNAQAASTVEAYAWPGLKDVVALYLSRQYNAPTRATAAIETALEQAGCEARVACASPDETLSVLPEGESAGDGNETAVEEPASEQLAPESPASEEPASEQSAHESPVPAALAPYSAPEDILLPEQAREMGYTDLQGLLALWVQQGCLAESPVISADGLLRALIAADILDPRDMTPTEKGIELGVWAAFETEGLAPIFAACMAGGLWEHVQAFL